MRKVKLYAAVSLNGKISKPDGNVHWLSEIPNPDKIDHGFHEFYKGVAITIQGNNTYKKIMSWGIEFPYKTKENYVFTKDPSHQETEDVSFISQDHVAFVNHLKNEHETGDIWLVGGGQLNTMFFNEGLIDEMQVFVMPIILEDGINLFEFLPKEKQLKLIKSKSFSTGAVELKYQITQ